MRHSRRPVTALGRFRSLKYTLMGITSCPIAALRTCTQRFFLSSFNIHVWLKANHEECVESSALHPNYCGGELNSGSFKLSSTPTISRTHPGSMIVQSGPLPMLTTSTADRPCRSLWDIDACLGKVLANSTCWGLKRSYLLRL